MPVCRSRGVIEGMDGAREEEEMNGKRIESGKEGQCILVLDVKLSEKGRAGEYWRMRRWKMKGSAGEENYRNGRGVDRCTGQGRGGIGASKGSLRKVEVERKMWRRVWLSMYVPPGRKTFPSME